uniref:Uncharacterized protein n=1 Tax=Anopheles dirus TaxID=7168 RepID=A0A182NJV6_9DIPT
MFAKLFIVALAVVCAAAVPPVRNARDAVFPLAYSAGVVPSYAYSAPVSSYSTYSGAPVTTYSTYSGSPIAYSAYSAPAVVAAPSYYYGRSIVSIVTVCSLLAVASAEPHVLAPAVVTAQSSQVFARTYNGFVPFAVPAPVPAPVPVPAYHHYHTPGFVLPAAHAPVFYPQPVVYNPPAAIPVPVPVPVPAAPAAVVPTVVAAAPAAKLVAAAPVAKVAKLVRPFHATFRYRSVVA